MKTKKSFIFSIILALSLFFSIGSFTSYASSGSLGISKSAPEVGDEITVTVKTDSGKPTLTFTSKVLSAVSASGGTVSGNTVTFSSTSGSVTFKVQDSGTAELILKAGDTKVSSAAISVAKASKPEETTTNTDSSTDSENTTDTTENAAESDSETTDTTEAGDSDNTDSTETTDSENTTDANLDVLAQSVGKVMGSNGTSVLVSVPEAIPSSFSETILPNGDESTVVYQFADFPNDFYYVYGTEATLGEGWYVYDNATGTLTRADFNLISAYDSLKSASESASGSTSDDSSDSNLLKAWSNMGTTKKIMVVVAIAVIIIIAIIIINMIFGGRHSEDEDDEDDENEDDEDDDEDSVDEDSDDEDDEDDYRKKLKEEKLLEKERRRAEKARLKAEKIAERKRLKEEEKSLLDEDDEDDEDADLDNDEDDEEEEEVRKPLFKKKKKIEETESEDEKEDDYIPAQTQVLPHVADLRDKLKEEEQAGKENPYLAKLNANSMVSPSRKKDSSDEIFDAESKRALFWARKNFYSEENIEEAKEDLGDKPIAREKEAENEKPSELESEKTYEEEEEKPRKKNKKNGGSGSSGSSGSDIDIIDLNDL